MSVGFTHYNLLMLLAGIFSSNQSVSEELHSLCSCISPAIFLSFHSSLLFDRHSLSKMADRCRMSMRAFHAANVAAHVLPLLILLSKKSVRSIRPYHGRRALLIHLAWGLLVSKGSLCLDEVYIRMSKKAWRCMFMIAFATELATPLLVRTFLIRPHCSTA